MDSCLSAISSIINCAVCLASFRPPIKVLPCGHSYCYRCLVGIKRSGVSFGRQSIRCPTCRQETLLPRGVVHQLPTNYALQQLLVAMNVYDEQQTQSEILEECE